MELKNIVYSTIERIGKDKIRSGITSDIRLSQKYIDIILFESIAKMGHTGSNTLENEETIMGLSEVLLHAYYLYPSI